MISYNKSAWRIVYTWSTGWTAAVALSSVWWFMALTAVADKSPTFDEPNHLVGGYTYWTRNDYRLHPENGNLPQRWMALPLIFDKPINLPGDDDPLWIGAHEWAISRATVQELEEDRPALINRARGFAACFGFALLLLVYAWARRLFGPTGGMLALFAGTFDPTLLANGPLLTSDTAMALTLFASATLFWSVMHNITLLRVLCSILVLGCLFLSKFSAPFIVLVAAILVIIRLVGNTPLLGKIGNWRFEVQIRWRQFGIILGLVILQVISVWALIWGAYGFRYSAFAPGSNGHFMISWKDLASQPSNVQNFVAFGRKHHLLPEAYLYGLSFVDAHTVDRPAFMNGEIYRGNRLLFFPFTVAVKTPLGLIALVLLGIVGCVLTRKISTRARIYALALYDTAPLAVVFVLYVLFALSTGVNIGIRHLLPIYPILYITIGGTAGWIVMRSRVMIIATSIALVAHLSASLISRPHYLAFFNSAVDQNNAHHYLVDSSLDWGQDLYGVREWIDKHSGDQQVYLAYFGNLDPRRAGISVKLLPGYFDFRAGSGRLPDVFHLQPGIYCISATILSGVYSSNTRPWTKSTERKYRMYQQLLAPTLYAPNQSIDRRTLLAYLTFDELRFGRLTETLRQREPDAHVGHSILIYRVGAEELKRALHSQLLTDEQ